MMRLSCLVAILAALSLAACGGGDRAASHAPGTPQNPLPAQEQDTQVGTRSNEATATGKTKAAKPGYQALLEQQSSKPRKRFTPCNLVTQAQARAIVGERVQPPLEAPQGPTCIYQTKRGRMFTVAIQSQSFRSFKRQIGAHKPVRISGRTAYCGTAAQPTLAVPLSRGRVLSVAAPCAIARQFALKAVQRLNS